ncbi:MAG: hypothetical protein QOK31_1867 [Solirubrobacteraceae bacterium]|nr:hypothetical protein [Solirubrobacteraceae bacterium]
MLDLLHVPFVQRGLLEVLALSVAAGLVGTWIVLRGLAFYAHALGTAAFPGLVLADGLGFAPPLGALGAATLFTGGVARLGAGGRRGHDSAVALVLVGFLAAGVVLASDVLHSGARIETLLFGSLLLVEPRDIVVAAVASLLALAASLALGARWLASGFEPARTGSGVELPEAILLVVVAGTTVAALSALGALLAAALLVVPAATARLWTIRMTAWQLVSVGLAAIEGSAGLWLSVRTNAPPGPAIAVVAGATFVLAALARPRGRPVRALVVAAPLALALSLGTANVSPGAGARLLVVASTTQVADFARAVGGAAVYVHPVLRANTDPHEYEPRPRDVIAASEAKLVVTSGFRLDAWMQRVVEQAGGASTTDLSLGLPVRLKGPDGGADPHWWHDPLDVGAAIQRLRDALARADPAHAGFFAANAARYERRLQTLNEEVRRCIHLVPAAARTLVTSHDSLAYFARRYGLRIVGAIVPAQAESAEPSARDVAHLTAQVRSAHVRAIFLERSTSPRLGRAVSRETGVRTAELYGDTLGPPGSPGETYLGMVATNASTIVRGLTGGKRGCAGGGPA